MESQLIRDLFYATLGAGDKRGLARDLHTRMGKLESQLTDAT